MKTQTQLPAIGARVRMVSENSNWCVGELGTITELHGDRVAIAFDGREDDYTAFLDAFVTLETTLPDRRRREEGAANPKGNSNMNNHPLAKGDIVDVKNTAMGGKVVTEGRATICSPVKNQDDTYNVTFHGDGHRMTFPRFVLPEQKVS